MCLNKKYHLNDIGFKYKVMSQLKRLHQFLDLLGEFKIRYPQEVVFPNLESGRMDEIYLTSLDILIILEEESDYISNETLEKFVKYIFFARYMYYKEIHLLFFVIRIQVRNLFVLGILHLYLLKFTLFTSVKMISWVNMKIL